MQGLPHCSKAQAALYLWILAQNPDRTVSALPDQGQQDVSMAAIAPRAAGDPVHQIMLPAWTANQHSL